MTITYTLGEGINDPHVSGWEPAIVEESIPCETYNSWEFSQSALAFRQEGGNIDNGDVWIRFYKAVKTRPEFNWQCRILAHVEK